MRDELREIFIRGCNEKIEKREKMLGSPFTLSSRIKMIIQNY